MGSVQVGWGAEGREMGRCVFSQLGEKGKDFCPNFLQPALEDIDGSWELIPAFHNPLLRRWLAPWSTLKGRPLTPRLAGGRK